MPFLGKSFYKEYALLSQRVFIVIVLLFLLSNHVAAADKSYTTGIIYFHGMIYTVYTFIITMIKKNIMKKQWILMTMLMLFFAVTASAQQVSKDSINALKNETERLKIARKLNERKLKLADLQNQVSARTNDVQRTAEEAQKAAGENEKAAANLSNDAQDKDKAKAARKAASYAEKSAKEARKAVEKLDSLNKEIDALKNDIATDEQKLIAIGGEHYINAGN